MIFDSHAHYDDKKFDGIRDEILLEISSQGVGKIVNAGSSLESSRKAMTLSEKYDFLYFTAGVHPEAVTEDTKSTDWLSAVEKLCHHKKCVAVGEIGLDYYWDKENKELQKECFRAQMELARKLSLPVVVHDREAHGDCLEIVKEYPDVKGLFHCFSGSQQIAKEIFSLGWYISMGGVVTFKNARKTVELIEALPSLHSEAYSRLLLETDCPYLAPVPHRGELNHSGMIKFVVEKIASLSGKSCEEIENVTYDNAMRFYNLCD